MRLTRHLLFLFGLNLLSVGAWADSELVIDAGILQNQSLEMVVKEAEGRFGSALAMDIQYAPVEHIRPVIAKVAGRSLDFFRAWNPSGEAHVTVITPIEFYDVLRPVVSMTEIREIAAASFIQESDLTILGVGKGTAEVEGKTEETYFVIIESMNLRKIRQKIYDLYVAKGGNPESWRPQHFFPHITIGYTKRDLHEDDGVLKNMEHSFDSRFDVTIR